MDKGSKEREFTTVEHVLVQNLRQEPKWLDDTLTEQTDPVSCKVLFGRVQLWKRIKCIKHKWNVQTAAKPFREILILNNR